MAEQLRLTLDGCAGAERHALPQQNQPAVPDPPLESIGQQLCRARQRNGKMLMDVWRELKIAPHHVIAIEKSCFDALPGRVYVIGFVRTYANWLGLDAESIVARLKSELAGAEVRLPATAPSLPPGRKAQPEAAPAAMANAGKPDIAAVSRAGRRVPQRVAAGLMVSVLMYSAWYVLASVPRAAPPPVIPVPARLVAEAALPAAKLPPPVVVSGGEAAPMARAPALPPPIEVAPARPLSAVAETVNFDAQLPLGRRYGIGNRNSRVILRVHRAVRVAVHGIRNHMLINRFLAAGDTYRVPNLTGLKLNVPDAGAIEVILDGNTVGFAGQDGSAARGLPLDPQSIVKRYHWQQG